MVREDAIILDLEANGWLINLGEGLPFDLANDEYFNARNHKASICELLREGSASQANFLCLRAFHGLAEHRPHPAEKVYEA
jgi:hypothetical protein